EDRQVLLPLPHFFRRGIEDLLECHISRFLACCLSCRSSLLLDGLCYLIDEFLVLQSFAVQVLARPCLLSRSQRTYVLYDIVRKIRNAKAPPPQALPAI